MTLREIRVLLLYFLDTKRGAPHALSLTDVQDKNALSTVRLTGITASLVQLVGELGKDEGCISNTASGREETSVL